MKTYRVAILGCRSRGTSAARVYHAHPRTEVVGLCDLLEDRLNTLGDELDIEARFTDLDEMIRQATPDELAQALRGLPGGWTGIEASAWALDETGLGGEWMPDADELDEMDRLELMEWLDQLDQSERRPTS